MAGTFDGTLTSGQIIDLGKVGVKSGSYSVEISSSKTTLQPFRANVKPAQPKASQPLEEEVVVIDLDSVGQSISEGNSNELSNLDSNAVTLGKVGSMPGQSMESPEFINKIENETNTDNLIETEFQPLGEVSQSEIFNKEAPFNENDSILQTTVESLTSPEQQDIPQPRAQANPSESTEIANQTSTPAQPNYQGEVSPSVPGQSINDVAGTTMSTAEATGESTSEEAALGNQPTAVNQTSLTTPTQDNKPNQSVSERSEESPRIIQGFQSLAQNVSRGIQNLAQNLGLAPDAADQNQPQPGQVGRSETKDELKGPIYQKLLTSVSTGVFYNDDGTTFYAQPGTKAYEEAVENIKARVNSSEEPIYDDNGNVIGPTVAVNKIAEIANRVLTQSASQIADQVASQNTAINTLQNTTQSTAQSVAESAAQDAAQKAVQGALQNSNVDSVQDVVQNVLESTAQSAVANATQEVIQNAADIADKITEQIAGQNVIQQVSQDVSRVVTQSALQTAEQIAEGSMQEVSQMVTGETIQGVIKESVTTAAQVASESIQETTQGLVDTVQDAARVVIRDTIQDAQNLESSVVNPENPVEADDLKQLTYQELAQASGLGQASDAIQALDETLEQTEATLSAIEQNQSGRISIQRAGQIPGDNLGSNTQPAPGYYNEDGVFVEQPGPQFVNQQGPDGVEQVQLPGFEGSTPDAQRNYLESSVSPITGQPINNMGDRPSTEAPATSGTGLLTSQVSQAETSQAIEAAASQAATQAETQAATQAATQAVQVATQAVQAETSQAISEAMQTSGQFTTRINSPEMVSLPEAQTTQGAQIGTRQALDADGNAQGTNTTDAVSSPESVSQQSKVYSVAEQNGSPQIDSNGNVLPSSANGNLNQPTYEALPENQTPSSETQEQVQERRRDRINLTSGAAGNAILSSAGVQEVSIQAQSGQAEQSDFGSIPGQSAQTGSIFDATIQQGQGNTRAQDLTSLQQVPLPQASQVGEAGTDSPESSMPRLFAINRRTQRPDNTTEDNVQQPGRINLNNTLQPRDIEKISEQIINEGLIPQTQEAPGLTQLDYQGLDQQQPRPLNPVITGINASGSSETEEEDENSAKLKSVKYITVGGDTLMKTEVPKDQPTDSATTQQIKEALSSESIIYQELLKERERFRANLEAERGNNRANLRRAEQQIQQELVKVITEQPLEVENESTSPINQIIQSIIKEDREIALERETESIQNTIQNVQERQQEANKVAQKETLEAIKTSQEKGPEKVFIDATKIIQMIQEKQKENESAKEIDEFLLRQRIERELKYEFNQMQIDHEKKLRMVYRKMIEQMYLDMLNS